MRSAPLKRTCLTPVRPELGTWTHVGLLTTTLITPQKPGRIKPIFAVLRGMRGHYEALQSVGSGSVVVVWQKKVSQARAGRASVTREARGARRNAQRALLERCVCRKGHCTLAAIEMCDMFTRVHEYSSTQSFLTTTVQTREPGPRSRSRSQPSCPCPCSSDDLSSRQIKASQRDGRLLAVF